MSTQKIESACESAHDILENARSVKGPAFTTFVSNAINLKSLLRLVHALSSDGGLKLSQQHAVQLATMVVNMVTTDLSEALDLSEEDVREALSAASLMDNAVQSAGDS